MIKYFMLRAFVIVLTGYVAVSLIFALWNLIEMLFLI